MILANRFSIRVGFACAIAILATGASADATEARYTCSGGTKLSAKFSAPGVAKGEVALTFDKGRVLNLPQVMSADGGRYAEAGIEFWIKGRSATLTMNASRKPVRRGDRTLGRPAPPQQARVAPEMPRYLCRIVI